MTNIPDIPYASIRSLRGACFHEGRSIAQANLYEIDWEGRPALLKDFSDGPWLLRRFWSRPVAAREVGALRFLTDVPGVPRLLATAGPDAFIIERLDGVRLPRKDEAPPSAAFWADARRILDALHAHGIGHGDIRRKNILIGPQGEAYFIDFATAICLRQRGLGARLNNFLLRRCQQIDRATFAKIKATYANVPLDADEQAWLDDQPWFLKLGRFLKKRVYRLRKPSFWRDRLYKARRWVRHRIHGVPTDPPPPEQ